MLCLYLLKGFLIFNDAIFRLFQSTTKFMRQVVWAYCWATMPGVGTVVNLPVAADTILSLMVMSAQLPVLLRVLTLLIKTQCYTDLTSVSYTISRL